MLWIAVVDARRTSPGPLSAAHARIEELQGRSGCAECHGGLLGNMTSSCRECHAEIAQPMDERRGLHGSLEPGLAERCALCHSEHLGPGFASVNAHSFREAGFARLADFDHARVGWTMDGAHLELDCARCHTNSRKLVLAEGERRYLGLAQDCASCHEDPHRGEMQAACAACHGQADWKQLFSAGHERFLPLEGAHRELDCRGCHARAGAHSLEALGGDERDPDVRSCAECHASPHAPGFVAAFARSAEQPEGESCVRCHALQHTSFRESTEAGLAPEVHALSGFALDAPHDEQACDACHAPGLADFRARFPGRAQEQCSACHGDPHGGQFARGPFAAQGCLGCHARERFEPHEFDLAQHARTALPLEGAHAEAACAECHEQPDPAVPRAFAGTSDTCSDCHADAHAGFFDARAQGLVPIAHGDCARCHDASDFARVPDFAHGRWTGFELDAAHSQEACDACHPARAAADERGRSFGLVAERFGPFTGCAGCHADPHEGAFDAPGLPARVEGRADCARCHVESSFRTLAHGFDHGAWTGFALAGGHAAADCTACHARLAGGAPGARTWGRARGPGCADCHPDPHAGQFTEQGRSDCARCHAPSRAGYLVFDHERDARFALGEAHARLACNVCHAERPLTDGASAVHYRPLPTECVDCHGVREDVLPRRRRGGGG